MGRVGLAGVRGPPWGRAGAGLGAWLRPAGRGDPSGRGSAHPSVEGTTPPPEGASISAPPEQPPARCCRSPRSGEPRRGCAAAPCWGMCDTQPAPSERGAAGVSLHALYSPGRAGGERGHSRLRPRGFPAPSGHDEMSQSRLCPPRRARKVPAVPFRRGAAACPAPGPADSCQREHGASIPPARNPAEMGSHPGTAARPAAAAAAQLPCQAALVAACCRAAHPAERLWLPSLCAAASLQPGTAPRSSRLCNSAARQSRARVWDG